MALLKRPYNDVDIFVEDTGNHNMWLVAARRTLPAGTRIASVNMLGGRDAVVAACKLDQSNTGRRKLYIIDGDFDYLLGKGKPKLKYLYRLRAYCFENTLLSESGLIQVGLEAQPTRREVELASSFDYQTLHSEMEAAFRPLFVAYAVAHRLARQIQTVGYSVRKLFIADLQGAGIDIRKVKARVLSIYREVVRRVGLAVTRATKLEIQSRANNLSLSQIVSGKDYLMPLVLTRFKARCGYRSSAENLKVALAGSFDRSAEPYFARRMARISA